MQARIIEIVVIRLIPSNKIADKSMFQIKSDIPKPKIRIDIDKRVIVTDALI